MRKKRILSGILIVVIMVISVMISCVYAEEKVDLKLRLEKGQSYKTKTTQDMKINQTVPGQVVTITQKTEMRNMYTVEDVQADSTLVLKVTYDAILSKIWIPDPNQNIEYDSSDTSVSSDNPIASIFGAIAGQSLIITITSDGHVKEIKGADALWERIQEKINELSEGGPERAGMETQMKMQYSEEALKTNTENSFNMYPDNPIGIGDTWQRKTTMNQGFPMVIDAIYTLKERKNGIAVIDVFAMIQTNRDVGPIEMGPDKIQYNMSGSVTGIMEIQESTGWIKHSNQNMRLTGSIIVQSPEIQQPISMPISVTGTINVEPY